MTIEEIFTQLSAHMAKGLLIHEQLSQAFGFLNLEGYCKSHKYHYLEETKNYLYLQQYYLRHYNKLLSIQSIEQPNFIPPTWFQHTRMDVDANTIRTGIRNLFKVWIDWEIEAKALFEKSYVDLCSLGAIDTAQFIAAFARETSEELAQAQEHQMRLEAMGYDLTYIMDEQVLLKDYYYKQIKEIFDDD